MSSVFDQKMIERVLTRGVERVYPSKEALAEKLAKGERLTMYYGIDPTGPTLHLGHTIQLRKIAEFQGLGHKVILLIGDFTAMIGDPTDKAAVRKPLTREQVLENCKRYKEQASKFLAFDGVNPAEMRFNSEWLAQMSFQDVIELSAHFTVQQMLERDMFAKRMKEAKPIHVHEFLYPLMQGYDSVALDTDVEIGGNDQTFNMLAGRDLLHSLKQKEKFVIASKLLADPSGVKMGKSEGNMIALTDTPEDMYGKVMSWPDSMILPTFTLCTNVEDEHIEEIRKAITGGENPMLFKRELAFEITTLLTGIEAAKRAAEHFTTVHQKQEQPVDIPELRVASPIGLVEALVMAKLVDSKTEARRQIEQRSIKVGLSVVEDLKFLLEIPPEGLIIQKGKRAFIKLVAI